MSESTEPRDPDAVDRALDSFDHALDVVHDRVLRPILIAGRAAAFAFIIVLMAVVLVSVVVIGLIRLLDVYAFARHQWLSYVVVGVASLFVGLVIWRRRRPVKLRK